MQVGDIITSDPQSDNFEGQYKLIEHLGGNKWLKEDLPDSPEVLEAIRAYYMDSEAPYLDYVDPFGPNRRRATRQESLDMELANRAQWYGHRSTVTFVSRAQWAQAF